MLLTTGNNTGNYEGSPTLSSNFMNFDTLIHKRPKTGPSCLSVLRKCCMLLLYQPSEGEITEQNSATFKTCLEASQICKRTSKICGFPPL